MSHRIIMNNYASNPPTTLAAPSSAPLPPTFNFEYSPSHDLTDEQAGHQFAKIQKLLNKAVLVASGDPTE